MQYLVHPIFVSGQIKMRWKPWLKSTIINQYVLTNSGKGWVYMVDLEIIEQYLQY
jgi:hypothetical protein